MSTKKTEREVLGIGVVALGIPRNMAGAEASFMGVRIFMLTDSNAAQVVVYIQHLK
jgi:hypothetical protein